MRWRVLVPLAVVAVGVGLWLEVRGVGEGPRGSRVAETSSPAALAPSTGEGLAPLAPDPDGKREASVGPVPDVPVVSPSLSPPRSDAATLRLRLVARETQAPLAGVGVWLAQRGNLEGIPALTGFGGREDRTLRSNAEGRIEFHALAGLDYEARIDPALEAHVDRRPHAIAPLAPGERREVDLELTTRDDSPWLGRVVDTLSGEPLVEARVEWLEQWPAGAAAAAETGNDGILALTCMSWQETPARVVKDGYLPAEIVLRRGHETRGNAELVRLSKPARLEVHARDEAGAPLADIAVELRLDLAGRAERERPLLALLSSAEQRSGRTDEAGTCVFEELPPRVLALALVRRMGEMPQRSELQLEPGETRALVFEFGRGCRIDGSVVDEEGGPIAGLDLWRLAGEDPPALLRPSDETAMVDKTRTDGKGRFVFENVPPGESWIGAAPYENTGGAPVPPTKRVSIARENRTLRLQLVAPVRWIRGRVVAPAGEEFVAVVTAMRGELRVQCFTSSSGEFGIGPLAEGEWSLQAAIPDSLDSNSRYPPLLLAPSERRLVPAGESDVVLRLRGGGQLGGRVFTSYGSPAAGAHVLVVCEDGGSPQGTACGSGGLFHFDALPPGRCRVLARLGEDCAVLYTESVATDEWSDDLELHLAPAATFRLVFTPADGRRWSYRLSSSDGLSWLEGRVSAAAGLCERLPSGALRLELFDSLELDEERRSGSHDVVLSAGEETRLELEKPDAEVHARER